MEVRGLPTRMGVGRIKNGGLMVNKQGQRRDVPEGGIANIVTLRSNVAT